MGTIIIISFSHRDGASFAMQPDPVETTSFGIIPQVGDLYKFEGTDYMKIVERRWFTQGNASHLELIVE